MIGEGVERKRLTNHVWEQMVERAKHCCLKCGEPSYPMSQDHVISIKDGGTNDAGNIQPLCLKCNLRKGDSTEDYRPADWPWREKAVEVRVRKPGPEFLAAMARINKFMAEWRKANPKATFVSAVDPQVRWMRRGMVFGECGACAGYHVAITPEQMERSIDNWVGEAHVAWHLAREMAEIAMRLEAEASKFYLPEDGPK